MKFKNSNIEGTVVKSDDRYIVKDNTFLKNLVVSSNPSQLITDSLETEKPRQKPTIRDFLRHTSGMTYYEGGTIKFS